jgi:tetratricopeptide (TPR) repeat protein
MSVMARASKKRRKLGWALAAVAVLAGLGGAVLFWRGPLARRIARWTEPPVSLAQAQAAYEARDWTRAAELSRRMLLADSNDVRALLVYARAQARLERHTSAAGAYTRLRTERMQAEDYFLLGMAKARTGDLQSALDLWEKGEKTGGATAEHLDYLTRAAGGLERLDLAASYSRALAAKPGWEARGQFLLAETLALEDNFAGAVEAVRAGLTADPEAKGAAQSPNHYRRLLARSLLKLGRPAEAQTALEAIFAAEGLSGIDAEAEWLLSRAYLQQGRTADAAKALDRAGSYRSENPVVPEPCPYVGSAKCAPCHRDVARAHAEHGHSRTFHKGAQLVELAVPDQPLADTIDPKVTHVFERTKDGVTVATHIGDSISRLVVEYAFGPRGGYVTMVGRDDDKTYRAARLSSYPTPEGIAWGRTGIDVSEIDLEKNVAGQPVGVRDGVVRCLYCHVTRSRDFRDPPPAEGASPAAVDPAIGCERCHGPGKHHVLAMEANFAESAIVNTAGKNAATINKQCSDCHIVGTLTQILAKPDDPDFLRSPGATLTVSRCFTESNGALSCLSCHDGHFDADKSPAAEEAKCLACHAGQQPKEAAKAAVKAKVCPVNAKTGCLECHMPKISRPLLHMALTDHYIRVRSDKPRRLDAAGAGSTSKDNTAVKRVNP